MVASSAERRFQPPDLDNHSGGPGWDRTRRTASFCHSAMTALTSLETRE